MLVIDLKAILGASTMVSLVSWELCGEMECADDETFQCRSSKEDDVAIKVVFLGESGVGKSSLALRFVSDEFSHYTDSTIGASYLAKKMTLDGNLNIPNQEYTFKIWDTAGQERYHSLIPLYYRGAAAAILVFDVSRPESLPALTRWVVELRNNGPADIVLVLCGNKSDLVNDRRISHEDAAVFADRIGAFYVETSARNSSRVNEVFHEIAVRVSMIQGASQSNSCTGLVDAFDVESSPWSGICCFQWNS